MAAYTYLVHLDAPIGNPENPRGQAQHYIGYCRDLTKRIMCHASGRGARLLAAAGEAGVPWSVVRTWRHRSEKAAREHERRLKARHKSRCLCPACTPTIKNAECHV